MLADLAPDDSAVFMVLYSTPDSGVLFWGSPFAELELVELFDASRPLLEIRVTLRPCLLSMA
jgi:hypothetical protein